MTVKKIKKGPFEIKVSPNDQIVLTSTIGNAQIGGNIVKLETAIVAKGEVKNLVLGKGSDLIGKTLRVYTNVLDVNPSSNRVIITHLFYNALPLTFSYPQSSDDEGVDNDGDIYALTVDYKIVIA